MKLKSSTKRVCFVALLTLCGCATTPQPTSDDELDRLDEPDRLRCRIEAQVFEDLGRLRDAGQPQRLAAERVQTKYLALAGSLDQVEAINAVLAHRNDSAELVYQQRPLKPLTLRYVGSGLCLVNPAKNLNPNRAATLQAAAACQQQVAPGANDAPLQHCILGRALAAAGR